MSDNAPQPAGRKRRDLATYDLTGLKHNGQKKCPECGTFVGTKFGTGASGKPCNGKIGDGPCTYHWTRQDSKRVKLKAEALEKHKQAATATQFRLAKLGSPSRIYKSRQVLEPLGSPSIP